MSEVLAERAIEALSEIIAEIDAGHLGRLTRIEGMKGWQETSGTQMAREVLASLKPSEWWCSCGLAHLPGQPDCYGCGDRRDVWRLKA